ncbi:YebC/PmpR family DNA-binding transcriptional regulator [Paenibacillus sp. S-38]|uniref:YebC/PmpR family DNA-binding transcriptional regulator n=1 Tax=Paenibacillus sp. S-38 TaxID=3416710 RepID=UPI003CF5700D
MNQKWNKIRAMIASDDVGASLVYERFGREIYVAARRGEADPELHRSLNFVLDRANSYNVPQAIVDRTLEKARVGGEERYEEIRYEGTGPHGSMVIVEALTPDANRTTSVVRDVFENNGISLDERDSVACLFDAMGVIGQSGLDFEDVYKLHIEEHVDQFYFIEEEDTVICLCNAEAFSVMEDALRNAGVSTFTLVERTMEPQDYITLPDAAKARFEQMIRVLEGLEDVLQVYHNVDLDGEYEEEAIEPPYSLSDEERALFSAIKNAIGQVDRYSYEGSMSMNGRDTELTMILEGDILFKPEFSMRSKSSFQSGDMDVEQETIVTQGKVFSANHVNGESGEWMVSDDLGDGAAQVNLAVYFSAENLEAAQEIHVSTIGDAINIAIRFNANKVDRIAQQQHRTPSRTVAAQHRFKVDTATMLPVSVVLEVESDDGDGFVIVVNTFAYAYNETAKEIVPPMLSGA